MGIKWKKFSRCWITKCIAYLCIVALSAGFVLAGVILVQKVGTLTVLQTEAYQESTKFQADIARVFNNVMELQYDYGDQADWQNSNIDSEFTLYNMIYNSGDFIDYQTRYKQMLLLTGQLTDNTPTPQDLGVSVPAMLTHPEWDIMQNGIFVQYLSENEQLIEDTRKLLLEDAQRQLARIDAYLQSVKGNYAYYAFRQSNQKEYMTATEEEIHEMPYFAMYDIVTESVSIYQTGSAQAIYTLDYAAYITRDTQNQFRIGTMDKIMVGITPTYFAQQQTQWMQQHQLATACMTSMMAMGVLIFAFFIYLCIVSGKVPEDTQIHLSGIEDMYAEVHVLILFGIGYLVVKLLPFIYDSTRIASIGKIFILGVALAVAVSMVFSLSIVRLMKAHRLLRSFLTIRLLMWLYKWCITRLHAIWQAGSLMKRCIALAVILPLLCWVRIMIPIIIFGSIIFVFRTVRKLQSIQQGVQQVQQGDLTHKIAVTGGEFGALADYINALSDGLEHAISSEVRAERLKTELITNVSHDVKTPLTSIVTYVDLLKNELKKQTPDVTVLREYAKIIDGKTARLRMLTTDLFEAAKATSGAIQVSLEQVDVQALVRQGLGEFDDKLKEAMLDVRVHVPQKPLYIHADGRLVWRILENMLSNVIKYAQPNSRVYLEISAQEDVVQLTMKNVSAFALNIPAEELLERFKRGDESRSSEGSGLGLSIATSLAQLQQGTFTIAVDGDLFKATLTMPAYHPLVPVEETEEN